MAGLHRLADVLEAGCKAGSGVAAFLLEPSGLASRVKLGRRVSIQLVSSFRRAAQNAGCVVVLVARKPESSPHGGVMWLEMRRVLMPGVLVVGQRHGPVFLLANCWLAMLWIQALKATGLSFHVAMKLTAAAV